ncbi:MAG: RNA-binding protein, partial [Gammaproteobacteria bacterium]
MKKLFIGNLPPGTSEEELQKLFSAFGKVRSSK